MSFSRDVLISSNFLGRPSIPKGPCRLSSGLLLSYLTTHFPSLLTLSCLCLSDFFFFFEG